MVIKLFLDFQSQSDIAIDITPFKQVILLKHVANASMFFFDWNPIDPNRTFFRLDQATKKGEQSGFATAGRSDYGKKFSCWDCKGYIRKGGSLAIWCMIGIMNPADLQFWFHRLPPKICHILKYERITGNVLEPFYRISIYWIQGGVI